MSKGPGKIERIIEGSLIADGDQAPTVEELCELAYPGLNFVEKKHRVAAARAARKVCARLPGWGWSASEGLGGASVYWNRYSIRSYALMKIKSGQVSGHRYRTNDKRIPMNGWRMDAAEASAMIEPGGKFHHYVVEGGAWHRHVRRWTIERDNDTSPEALAFLTEVERENAKLEKMLGVLGDAIRSGG